MIEKIIESYHLNDMEILTDDGWKDITDIHKTIEYDIWYLKTESGKFIEAADDHIIFDENYNEVFVKDCIVNKTKIITIDGPELIIECFNTNQKVNMYDVSVDSDDHRFFGNDILSHNTTTAVTIILHYVLFNEHKRVALLANKGDTAREILARIKLAYEALPKWLTQGIIEWNKGSVEFENGCKIVAAASSTSSIRGTTCVSGDTKVCVENEGKFFYVEIDKIINNRKEEAMPIYTVYRTINKINNKEYIGFHKIWDESSIINEVSDVGSIFDDGYLGSGKLIKRALEKYGPENFYQELLYLTENKIEAEQFEKNAVNIEYVSRPDTYNVSIGGNVCILYGENNGFYGKKLSEESKEKRKKTLEERNYRAPSKRTFFDRDGNIYNGYNEIIANFHNGGKHYHQNIIILLGRLCYENILTCTDADQNNIYIERYKSYLEWLKGSEERKKYKSDLTSTRFKGKKKSLESNLKRGESIKKWISEHPEEHSLRMQKINKNPEKIRKTSSAHIGMKRSAATRLRMSNAAKGRPPKNKGMISAYDKDSFRIKYFENVESIPSNFILGMPKRASKKNTYANSELIVETELGDRSS